jgi:hypothetical protein
LEKHKLGNCLDQCCGSMKFWWGSESTDPYLGLMDLDPDPVIFISDLSEWTFTSFFKEKSHKEVTKQ